MAAYSPSSQTQRQSLYVNVDPHTYDYDARKSPQSPSPSSSSAKFSIDTADTSNSYDSGTPRCTVLCLYDWSSDDPDHLNFTQNELLDVVRQEDSGWWAAMRSDSEIGWIPQAYVERLSEDMVEKLRNTPKEYRCKEYNAEQLYTNQFDLPSYEPFEPLSPSPPSPRLSRRERERDATVPHLTLSTKTRELNVQAGLDSDSEYRVIFQRIQSDQNASLQSSTRRHPYAFSQSQKQSQYIFPIEQEPPNTRHRAGTVPNAAGATVPKRRDEPSSATNLRPLYGLNRPEVGFSKSRNAIEGLMKRNGTQRMSTQVFHEDKPLPRIAEPSFRTTLHADKLETDENGQVRFGTLEALVERLTSESMDIQNRAEHTLFRSIFLMTFRTFMTADELFDMLVDIYQMDHPKDLASADFEEWKKHLVSTQTRVLEVFDLWLTDHRLLQDDAHIAQKLTEFLKLILSPPLAAAARRLTKQIERLTFSINSPTSPKRTKKSKAHKNDLLKLEPVDIAEQLTLIESKRYVKITPKECLQHIRKQAPVSNLSEFCSTHDKIVSWVKTCILTVEALGKRATIIEFWIKVAEKCKAMNNLASMSAIITALSSTVITRLHLTWAHVGRKNVLDGLLKYNEPTGGFAGYRNLLVNVDGPCVPFITMFLTDLVHIQDAFADEPNGRICFLQRQRSYETITLMLQFQSRSHDIAESESLISFITRNLQDHADKDNNWFWAKSQEVQTLELHHADIRKGLEAAGF
ncbi:hypothetical protein H0H87_006450 [Tephrocybe sp. NHM501043]|nr:hypothetical protein H0H87_006450 [Tephrocybe sp. NHM501043]